MRKIRNHSEDLRGVIEDDGTPRTEIRIACTTCGREHWLDIKEVNTTDASGWFSYPITREHEITLCPRHAPAGTKPALEAREQINALAEEAVTLCSDLPNPRGRRTRVTTGTNPAGLYSQPTVEWLASLPSGKTTRYWGIKKENFSHLTKQQGRMNFPDLMEMRAWTILFRHADLNWNEAVGLWMELRELLETPYPVSDPEFLQDPMDPIRECPGKHQLHEAIIPRLEQFRSALTHEGHLPVRWNITHDLGVRSHEWTVIADQGILDGEPHIKGTPITLREIRKLQYEEEIGPAEMAQRMGIEDTQAENAAWVNQLLYIPGGPYKIPTVMMGP